MGPSTRRDLKALYRLVNQADLVLDIIPKPDPSIASERESLTAALALTKDLVERSLEKPVQSNPAAELGAKGGQKTAERGPEYFAKIAGMRKTNAGGRPKKTINEA